MTYIFKIAFMILIMVFLISGCGKSSNSPAADGEYPNNINRPNQKTDSAPAATSFTNQKTPLFPAISPGSSTKAPTDQQNPQSVLPTPAPFPDDGKVSGWSQSSQFPDYAYDNPSLPRQLYKYSFNQKITDKYRLSMVKPVDFYYETNPGTRVKLLAFFRNFISAYYTVNYQTADQGGQVLCRYLDPKKPAALVNGTAPENFVFDTIDHVRNDKLKTSVSQILTDESLMYLDGNAYYRVRGRVILNIVSSTDPVLPVGTQTIDLEMACKEKLLSGPGSWATEDYVVTLITKLQ